MANVTLESCKSRYLQTDHSGSWPTAPLGSAVHEASDSSLTGHVADGLAASNSNVRLRSKLLPLTDITIAEFPA